jgi:hypothetical protein
MSFKGLAERVESASKKANKSKLATFLDMSWCGFRYGAGYTDYDVIGFYKLNSKQRKTMLTRGKNNKIVKKFNNKKYWHIFNNKNEFNTEFAKFIQREWMIIDKSKISDNIFRNEEYIKFKQFVAKHNVFFAKPCDGQCGKGIERVDLKDLESYFKANDVDLDKCKEIVKSYIDDDSDIELKCLFKCIIDNKTYLLEEPIKQHSVMNGLNPSSINTIRVVSLMNNKGNVTILTAYLRIGNGINVVDNFNSGGMTSKVSVETGEVVEEAVNKEGKTFAKHPTTGTPIKGFKIPYFEEAKKMVIEAAKESKEVRYIGWDVAITENGPVLVEGNHFPGHDIYQVAEKLDENSIGVWPEFKKAIEL